MMPNIGISLRDSRPSPPFIPLTGELPALLSHSRDSDAWHFNSSGLMVVAEADVPRFDHDLRGRPLGFLVEPLRVNEIPQFSPSGGGSWSFFNSTETASGIEVIPGKNTGSSLILDDVSSFNAGVSNGVTAASPEIYTASKWVIGIGSGIGKRADLLLADFAAAALLNIGSIILAAEPQRVSLVSSVPVTPGHYIGFSIGNYQAFGGTSNLVAGNEYAVDGCQFTISNVLTSSIITSGAALARDEDYVTFTDTSRDVEILYKPLGSDRYRSAIVAAGNQPVGIYGHWAGIRQL